MRWDWQKQREAMARISGLSEAYMDRAMRLDPGYIGEEELRQCRLAFRIIKRATGIDLRLERIGAQYRLTCNGDDL